MDTFRKGEGGAQQKLFLDENSTKNQNLAPKNDHFYTNSYNFP